MPQSHTLSILNESAVRKTEPTLWALRMLSSTTTTPDSGSSLYSSAVTLPSSMFNSFLFAIKQKVINTKVVKNKK